MINARDAYNEWLSDPLIDEETKKELREIENDEKEIEDRFYRKLAFGTGGLRGVIGAGSNRMNVYTVCLATQGLADYVNKSGGADKGVAIAYDSRIMSSEFAEAAALCLNANGIRTYRFPGLRPTPELSFAVRELGCIAGIVITASHNPSEYNGYKVYWEDGGQITPPHDRNIMEAVAKVTSLDLVRTMGREEAEKQGLYHIIEPYLDDRYVEAVMSQSIHPDIIPGMADKIKIVYTPLNGAGNVPVRRILKELGFTQVYVVPEQEMPDGRFPTLPYPNPEEPDAWKLALKLAERVQADLVLATDPDADRLGVYARDSGTGKYVSFTGNMSGALICEYILRERAISGTMPADPAVVETIVTTDLAKPIAKKYGAALYETLTGFKYVGEQILRFEEQGKGDFLFGLEESYGCLAGTYARDKDACVAVMMLCELAAFYKSRNMTLVDAMHAIYEEYGYFKEGMSYLTLKGREGAGRIAQIMSDMRSKTPSDLAGMKVLALRDYRKGVRTDLVTGSVMPTGLPTSDVLYFELENDAWCCVRPSGTEPKIKFYCGVKGISDRDADEKMEQLLNYLTGELA